LFSQFLTTSRLSILTLALSISAAPFNHSRAQDAAPATKAGKIPDRQSLAEVQNIILGAIARRWKRPDQSPLIGPRMRFDLDRDGALIGEPKVDNPSDDPLFKAYVASAREAIVRASPFKLSQHGATYEAWKTVRMPFMSEAETLEAEKAKAETARSGTKAEADWTKEGGETSANIMPNYKANGNEIHGLTLYRELKDGTPTLAMAFCGVGSTEGSFAFGVDFGKGMTWKGPEEVEVRFGDYRQVHTMQVMREYLGFEGPTAKAAIEQLVASKGRLAFFGPRNISVSFDLDGAGEVMSELKRLCKI
jgi:hypothetical protein